jgi:hypothetical protein
MTQIEDFDIPGTYVLQTYVEWNTLHNHGETVLLEIHDEVHL